MYTVTNKFNIPLDFNFLKWWIRILIEQFDKQRLELISDLLKLLEIIALHSISVL